MSTATEKYLSGAIISETPVKKLALVIKDGSVTTAKVADGAITEDKLGEAVKNKVQAALDAETTARKNADTTLQQAISTEVTRAKAAEESLQKDINQEVTRATAGIETNAANIETNGQAIQGLKERAARSETNLDNEISRAKAAETTLQTNIDAEVTRAKAAEESNAEAASNAQKAADAAQSTADKGITEVVQYKDKIYLFGKESNEVYSDSTTSPTIIVLPVAGAAYELKGYASYSSSDNSVATVGTEGYIFAVGNGITTITAVTSEGVATIVTVFVKAKEYVGMIDVSALQVKDAFVKSVVAETAEDGTDQIRISFNPKEDGTTPDDIVVKMSDIWNITNAGDLKLSANYAKASSNSAVTGGDTIEDAISKLEKQVDDKQDALKYYKEETSTVNAAAYYRATIDATEIAFSTNGLTGGIVRLYNNKAYYNGTEAGNEIATKGDIPTKVSELTNDSGYQTAAEVKAIKVDSATSADSANTANSATSASEDSSGNVISETYLTAEVRTTTAYSNVLSSLGITSN